MVLQSLLLSRKPGIKLHDSLKPFRHLELYQDGLSAVFCWSVFGATDSDSTDWRDPAEVLMDPTITKVFSSEEQFKCSGGFHPIHAMPYFRPCGRGISQ